MGLLLVSLAALAARKLAVRSTFFDPFKSLGFFKLHYMIAGLALTLFFPEDFLLIFEPVRVTVITFGLCWIGFYYGCGLELRAHQRFASHIVILNIIEPVIVFIFLSFGSIIFFYYRFGDWQHSETALMIGLFSSFTIFRRRGILYRQSQSAHHPVLDNLLPIGNIFPVAALAVMSKLLFEIPEITLFQQTFNDTFSFILIQVVTGILGGMLINMLVSGAEKPSMIILVMVGCTAIIGGIVTTLSLSPLFVGMLTGAFLINSTLKRLLTLEVLNSSHDYMEKVFMFCLGTMLPPLLFAMRSRVMFILLSAIGLFVVRATVKYFLSTVWISRVSGESENSKALWIGLTGQGILASGAVVECSLPIDKFAQVFLLFITLLVINQIAIGLYVWMGERNRRSEGASDA